MVASRMVFSFPNLLRSVRACRPTTYSSISQNAPTHGSPSAAFHSTAGCKQETYPQRYGTAAEPRLPPPYKPDQGLMPMLEDTRNPDRSVLNVSTQDRKESPQQLLRDPQASEKDKNIEGSRDVNPMDLAGRKKATEDEEGKAATPFDIVLQTRQPSNVRSEQQKHPHLEPSLYEHHFDTYSLVQDLAKGGLTQEQAITLMKAVRMMLAINLNMAKDGLVSSSDVQNEVYLFRAACSELRTSLQSSRHSEIQRQRTQRAHLHHEYDILNQKVSQDMLSLREELKAMFNDRKMAIQEEKQRLDSKVSELNYEITVLLNSDSKREVEGLRWVLTRRAAMAIAISALMTLISLKYSSYRLREKEEAEKKIAAAKKEALERDEARPATSARDQGAQTASSIAESLG